MIMVVVGNLSSLAETALPMNVERIIRPSKK
jgi:hypothetical protein